MFELVIGGSGSGKSSYAENAICRRAGKDPLYYIATMIPFGKETQQKIDRHRRVREGKGFITQEWYFDISKKIMESGWGQGGKNICAILECVSNLTANEIYSNGKTEREAVVAVLEGIRKLNSLCRHLVVVTNDVFSESVPDTPEMTEYKKVLGKINRMLAQEADQVTEVMCGCACFVKRGMEQLMKETVSQDQKKRMHVITGGAYQGKSRIAKKMYPGIQWEDGNAADPESIFECEGMTSFHVFVRRWLEGGKKAEDLVRQIINKTKLFVIVSDEIGCGLVPVDSFEREYREKVGRIMTELCRNAYRVDRVTCGIEKRIK